MKREITLRRTKGNMVVPLKLLDAVTLPRDPKTVKCPNVKNGSGGFEGHTIYNVEHHLKTWTIPPKVDEVRERVERALEEGIPEQKRIMLRNQEDGMLNDAFADEIALGLDVENPFMRWNKMASDTCRVAVCIDSNVISWQTLENYQARVAMAAGVAMALESLDYEVMVVSAHVTYEGHGTTWGTSKPRISNSPIVSVRQLKREDESCASSHFAALSDTGIARLQTMWASDGNCHNTGLTNSEWREMTESDLFIHVCDPETKVNSEGLPAGEVIGLEGDDVLSLKVNKFKDIDEAIQTLENFFHENAE